MDDILKKGLDAIASGINKSTALSHPSDLGKTVELLDKLIEAGHTAGHTDEVLEYLTDTLKLPDKTAHEIHLVYEVLERRANGAAPFWKDDILDQLRKDAGTP